MKKQFFNTVLVICFTVVLTLGLVPADDMTVHAEPDGKESSTDGFDFSDRVGGDVPVDVSVNGVSSVKKRGEAKRSFESCYRSDRQPWAEGIRVKDQGSTGLCWAFAVTTAAEYSYAKESYENDYGDIEETSPGHLGYFAYNRVNDPLGNTGGDANHPKGMWATYGGNAILAMQHMATWSGLAYESQAPFDLIDLDDDSGRESPETPTSQRRWTVLTRMNLRDTIQTGRRERKRSVSAMKRPLIQA